MNKRGISSFVVGIIATVILVAAVIFFAYLIISTTETSSFATVCSIPASNKNLYYSMPEIFRRGEAPILHQQCNKLTPAVTTSSVNSTAQQLLTMAQSCSILFAGKNMISDEGNTLTCYLSSFDTPGDFYASDLKTYMDTKGEDIKILFVKENPTGSHADFIDMNYDAEVIPEDFEAEIIFSDWDTYSEIYFPTGNIPYLRDETVWCYLEEQSRQSYAESYRQDDGIVNAFTQLQIWEGDILLLARDGLLDDIGAFLGKTYLGGQPIDNVLLDLIGNFLIIINELFHEDRDCTFYPSESCGNLTNAMVCCEDKIIICIK